ncbi:putative dinucleotide-binding enzyme [Rhizobium soli]|uniref:Putative dinucleotide-binding enzyme n=1 Tax=Rhizobium soli TaxID=424798 RepID=A0A7X0JQM8_9HYPH|nr:hypothetical protein [Rhizobium soli]MBB6511102.1 putative dinucleotide-binding enzyme [Rhizobium soli]
MKAWNAIGSDSFARLGQSSGAKQRIAIPVAGGSDRDRRVAMALVEDTEIDAVDAGIVAGSGRQQPGAPSVAAVQEKVGANGTNAGADYLVRINRALFI